MHVCMATNSTCYRQPLAASPGEPRPIASEVAHCVRVAEDVSQTGQMVTSQTQCVRVCVCVCVCVLCQTVIPPMDTVLCTRNC